MRPRKKHPHGCANCTTERYPIEVRGFCERCYRLTLRLERIERGDHRALGSLGEYLYGHKPAAAQLSKLRAGFSRQIRERRWFLKLREEQRRSGVDGLTIEHLLQNIAKRAGARGDVNYNTATPIDHTFPPPQKRFLFRLLQNIEERIPWKLNITRALRIRRTAVSQKQQGLFRRSPKPRGQNYLPGEIARHKEPSVTASFDQTRRLSGR